MPSWYLAGYERYRGPVFAAAAAGGGGTTWDSGNMAIFTLDGTSLIATVASHTSTASIVRSVASHSSGKYFFEINYTNNAGGQRAELGIVNAAFPMDGSSELGTANDCCTYFSNGNVGSNGGAFSGTHTTWTQGDSVGFAVDLDADRFWINDNGGGWFGESGGSLIAGDPAAGTNGIATSLTHGVAIYAACGVQTFSVGAIVTGGFGPSSTIVKPTGYSYW